MRTLVKRIRAQYETMQTIHTLMTRLWRRDIQGFSVRREIDGFTVTVEQLRVEKRKAA